MLLSQVSNCMPAVESHMLFYNAKSVHYCDVLYEAMLKSLRRVLQVSWQLCSPVFGLVLRRYAPSDTYQVRQPILKAS